MLTLISHIFNEEYLLPFWLEYHKNIFNHGIIIDYYSTDRSVEIIRKYCPTWEIINTKNINEDGSPNFKAEYVDLEVMDIESRISGFRMCLNTTEFLFLTKPKEETMNLLTANVYYYLNTYMVMNNKRNFFPKNAIDFFKSIELVGAVTDRGHRILHSDPKIKYGFGRHNRHGNSAHNNHTHGLFFILWTKFYPCNQHMFKRKLQIQNNIPQSDKNAGWGYQHITNLPRLLSLYNTDLTTSVAPIDMRIKQYIDDVCQILQKNNIYYSELFLDGKYGDDIVMLDNDINLLQKTDFDNAGYKVVDIRHYGDLLQRFIKNEILFNTNKSISLENYHNEITSDEHTAILNSMPYKKNMYPDVKEFSEYIERTVSDILGEPVKIFNDDLWFRICRPSKVNDNDYNPCHRDVYLDFYRNVVNIYLPVVGSNDKSSLTVMPGSHKWSESDTMVTTGGAFFKTQNKKYSVDAIVASKQPIEMIRPNPRETQLMIFSPYLIHGCAENNNENMTRISLEVRFVRNDENGKKQEVDFKSFLEKRSWR